MSGAGPLHAFLTIVAVGALIALLIGVGRAALAVTRIEVDGDAAFLSFSLCLGLGLLATVLLIVCGIFGAQPHVLGLTLAAIALAASRSLRHTPGMVWGAIRELLECHPPGLIRNCASGALVGLSLLVIGLALPPAVDWDSLAYHLQIPHEWLAAGVMYAPDDNNHVAFVGVQHMLYLPLLGIGARSGPAVMSAFFALGAGLGTFAAARALCSPRVSVMAFWLLWTSPIVVLVGITPRVDVTLAMFLVTAHLGALLAWRDRNWRYAYLAAVMLGMAFGIKYLGWLYALALSPLVIAAATVCDGRPQTSCRMLCKCGLFAALVVVGSVPWLMKNWFLLDAPVFPFFTALRAEPWVQALYAEAGAVPSLSESLMAFHRSIRVPFNIVDLFAHPERLAPDAEARFSAPSVALLVLPLALLLTARRKVVAIVSTPLIFFGALLLYSRETSLRYLIPVLPGLTIAAALTLDGVRDRLKRSGRVMVMVVVALAGLQGLSAALSRLADARPWRVATGLETEGEYLSRYWETAKYMRHVGWLDTHLTATDTVMLLFDSRAYYTTIPVRQDMVHRTWALVEPFALSPHCLGQAGITHVLVNDGMRRYFEARGGRAGGPSWSSFERYARACLELIHRDTEFRVFRVRRHPVANRAGR